MVRLSLKMIAANTITEATTATLIPINSAINSFKPTILDGIIGETLKA